MSLDKAAARDLRAKLQPKLDAIGDENSCWASFLGDTITWKLTGVIPDAVTGIAERPEASDFRAAAHSFGMSPTDLGRKFTLQGRTYEVCGLQRKARVSPILCKRDDGKVFKFRAEDVKRHLGDRLPQPAKRPMLAIRADLEEVDNDLSPENLTCDGEIRNPRIIKERRDALLRRKVALLAELDHSQPSTAASNHDS